MDIIISILIILVERIAAMGSLKASFFIAKIHIYAFSARFTGGGRERRKTPRHRAFSKAKDATFLIHKYYINMNRNKCGVLGNAAVFMNEL